uniref:Serpentine receptor class gamma n=1 Tax=Meloidogyne incognita TaxID=6306 RepID=A0A914KLX0_MELIC
MMLTRLTAIMFLMKHDNIWKKLLPLSIIIIFGLPLLDSYILFLDTYVIIPLPNEQNMTLFIIPPKEHDVSLIF